MSITEVSYIQTHSITNHHSIQLTSPKKALASRATINAWDNSTRGLGNSTVVDYIHALRILSTLTHSTNIATLYQTGEQIYYGPGSAATSYLESTDFHRNPRSTTADFLTSMTDPNKRRIKPG